MKVTADSDLQSELANCEPGTDKPYSVIAKMDAAGNVVLSPDPDSQEEDTEDASEPASDSSPGYKPSKPVMAAMKDM